MLKSDHWWMETKDFFFKNIKNFVKIRPLMDGNTLQHTHRQYFSDGLKSDHWWMETTVISQFFLNSHFLLKSDHWWMETRSIMNYVWQLGMLKSDHWWMETIFYGIGISHLLVKIRPLMDGNVFSLRIFLILNLLFVKIRPLMDGNPTVSL